MSLETIRVLAIEDSPEDAYTYRRLLQKDPERGYTVFEAGDGSQGLNYLRSQKVDCILLDYNLPDTDGLELLAEITADEGLGRIPIIFLTGQGNEMVAVQALKSGATDYLVKSTLSKDLLVRAIRHAIEKKQTEETLRQTTLALQKNVQELLKANLQIITQQKTLIEEERLKVLLQMAGATAHELNQPLMVLLGSIQLLELDRNNPEKTAHHIDKIQQAGARIADIVKKIQTIRQHEIKTYAGESAIMQLDQSINILSIEDHDRDFQQIQDLLEDNDHIHLLRAGSHAEAFELLEAGNIHLIFLDHLTPTGLGIDFLMALEQRHQNIPVVIISGNGEEGIAARAIQAGAYDYLPKAKLSKAALSRIIRNTMEKYRLKMEVTEALKKVAELSGSIPPCKP